MQDHRLHLTPATDLFFPVNRSIHHNIDIKMNTVSLPPTRTVQYLGALIDDQLTFSDRVASVSSLHYSKKKKKIRPFLTQRATQQLEPAIVIYHINYSKAFLTSSLMCEVKLLQPTEAGQRHPTADRTPLRSTHLLI